MQSLFLLRPLHSQEQLVPPPPSLVLSFGSLLVSEDVGNVGKNCQRGLLEKYHLSLTTPVYVTAVKPINAFITTRHFFLPHCDGAFCRSPTNPVMLEILFEGPYAPPQMFMKSITQILNLSFNHSLSTVVFIYCISFMCSYFGHDVLRGEGR